MGIERFEISNLESLRLFAESFANRLPDQVIVLLHGPMGVGKTQFTKFLLEALGSGETVSPSFSLHNSYEIDQGVVDHLDLYRLENADDLESTGFWDLFESDSRVVIIEWSERLREFGLLSSLPRAWPQISVRLEFSGNSSSSRIVTVETV